MFPTFDPNLVQNNFLFEYGGSIALALAPHGKVFMLGVGNDMVIRDRDTDQFERTLLYDLQVSKLP